MGFVKALTIQVASAGSPGFVRFKLYGFLTAGHPVFVSTDLGGPGNPPLSVDEAGWTSLVDQCTNDIEYLLFDYFFEMKDVTWLECFPGCRPDG